MDDAASTLFAQESSYKALNRLPNQWYTSLKLNFARYAHGSRLASAERLGPLSVQKAFYPEGADCAHVCLLHPPAGIVSGDTLQLQTVVEEKAHALLTTPGDNLSATFSPELSDLTLYVIDVSTGDKIPRKGGPGITKSDLLIINKIDLAPMVGASLEVMDTDARRMRGDKPFIFTNLKTEQGVSDVIGFIETEGMLQAATVN